jgi:hypothetical protein
MWHTDNVPLRTVNRPHEAQGITRPGRDSAGCRRGAPPLPIVDAVVLVEFLTLDRPWRATTDPEVGAAVGAHRRP